MRELNQERLKNLLDYNPDSGIFTWRIGRSGTKGTGSVAGNKDNGYIHIVIDGKKYRAHRLAWMFVYGKIPESDIDHINGVKDNNRIKNLREATKSENHHNSKLAKNNISGVKGVCWNKARSKWQAQIKINRKSKYLGLFEDINEADIAVKEARLKFHKQFANNG